MCGSPTWFQLFVPSGAFFIDAHNIKRVVINCDYVVKWFQGAISNGSPLFIYQVGLL
jgi:hypothetical protein